MIKIINTGGTFNKRYDPIKGKMYVPADNKAIEAAVSSIKHGCKIDIKGAIYKDSLEMNDEDRTLLCEIVKQTTQTDVIIVHGTDTMDKSAKKLDEYLGKSHQKRVIFTGAMVPLSIDPIEATANLVMAISVVKFLKPNVYIAMHGMVRSYHCIVKNRKIGIFEPI